MAPAQGLWRGNEVPGIAASRQGDWHGNPNPSQARTIDSGPLASITGAARRWEFGKGSSVWASLIVHLARWTRSNWLWQISRCAGERAATAGPGLAARPVATSRAVPTPGHGAGRPEFRGAFPVTRGCVQLLGGNRRDPCAGVAERGGDNAATTFPARRVDRLPPAESFIRGRGGHLPSDPSQVRRPPRAFLRCPCWQRKFWNSP